MKLSAARARIYKQTEAQLDRIGTALTLKVDAEIKRTMMRLHKRFPRHHFEAYQIHGMLSVSVSPKVLGQHDITYLRESYKRGAIYELSYEIISLIDWHNTLDFRTVTYDSYKPISSNLENDQKETEIEKS